MTDIKFGMSFHDTYDYDPEGVVRHVRMVEELGMDSLWITENVNSGAPALESLVALATFAVYRTPVQAAAGWFFELDGNVDSIRG